MKRIIFYFTVVLGFVPFFLSDVQATEQQDTQQKGKMGDYIVSVENFKIDSKTEDDAKLTCQPSSIKFKPQKGGTEHELNSKQFVQLWDANGSFHAQSPNATLVFFLGDKMYQMTFTIPQVKQDEKSSDQEGKKSESASDLMIDVKISDPKAAFTEDGKNITKEDFMAAAAKTDKEKISIMIDSDPWDPRH